MLRNAAAFLVAPVPGAFVQSVMVALWPKAGRGIFAHPASMCVFLCLLLYGLGILFGVPARLVLRRAGLVSLRAFAAAGLIVVAAPVLLALVWVALTGPMTPYILLYDLGYFALTGLLAGATFWWIARPDLGASRRGAPVK